jgi:hypothetical protein
MKGGLLSAWLTEVVLVTYRVFKNGTDGLPLPMPLPSTYTSTMVIYGALGLAPESWNQATTLFGWGLVVATLLNIWTPGKATKAGGTTNTAAQTTANTFGGVSPIATTPTLQPNSLGIASRQGG